MKVIKSNRGFPALTHQVYVQKPDSDERLAMQSSAIGDYEDALDRPGTSYLWIGRDHHLSREEVQAFVRHLQAWLDTGQLEIEQPA